MKPTNVVFLSYCISMQSWSCVNWGHKQCVRTKINAQYDDTYIHTCTYTYGNIMGLTQPVCLVYSPSVVSRTRNWGIPQLLPLLVQNVNIYAPTNTNHFKHWRTYGNLLRNISILFKSVSSSKNKWVAIPVRPSSSNVVQNFKRNVNRKLVQQCDMNVADDDAAWNTAKKVGSSLKWYVTPLV